MAFILQILQDYLLQTIISAFLFYAPTFVKLNLEGDTLSFEVHIQYIKLVCAS